MPQSPRRRKYRKLMMTAAFFVGSGAFALAVLATQVAKDDPFVGTMWFWLSVLCAITFFYQRFRLWLD